MTYVLFSCATDKQAQRWTLAETLKVMQRVTTEQMLLEEIGPPHGVAQFKPKMFGYSDPDDWLITYKTWRETEVVVPTSLADTLPRGTKMLGYNFGYSSALVGGGLHAYVDKEGKILGYSYTKTLVGLETKARMHKRP